MIPIFVDTKALSEEFPMFQKDVGELMDYVVKEITAGFVDQWQKEALDSLGGSKWEYAKNIILVDEGFAKGAAVLVGWLPNAIESGLDPFDMKKGMLSGPNAKMGKNGMYNTIPFRLGNPEALDSNAIFSAVLPQEVYEAILQKPQNIPVPGGGVRTEGLKVEEIPERYREPVTRSAPPPPNKISAKDYKHKFSIYAGVSRVKDKNTGQNRYVSFRRVSENSDPDSWIHTGIEPRNIADKALDNFRMDVAVGKALDNYLITKGYV